MIKSIATTYQYNSMLRVDYRKVSEINPDELWKSEDFEMLQSLVQIHVLKIYKIGK